MVAPYQITATEQAAGVELVEAAVYAESMREDNTLPPLCPCRDGPDPVRSPGSA